MVSSYVHPKDPDIQKLAQEITEGKASDSEKLQAIHDWVVTHIEYDYGANIIGGIKKPSSMDASAIFKTRKAICQGYSDFVASLLLNTGIRVKIVMGRYIHFGTDLGDHAWNKALIDGRWVVLDTTLDAGENTPRNQYFDPNPEIFAEDHIEISFESLLVSRRHCHA